MRDKENSYEREVDLVAEFVDLLLDKYNPWGDMHVSTEFNYLSGKTDVVACTDNGSILAFEAKLMKWKDAVHQAYRSTSFADYSYVLLPPTVAQRAVKYTSELSKRNVGIVSIIDSEIMILHDAPRVEPIHKRLKSKACDYIFRDINGAMANGFKCCS